MPFYEYENIKTGDVIVLYKSVATRNDAPPGHRRIVSRFSAKATRRGRRGTSRQAEEVLDGFRAIEDVHAGKPWPCAYSKEEAKRIWEAPHPQDAEFADA